MQRTVLTFSGVVLLVVILVLINSISQNAFSSFSLDLTENKIYSVSQGTKNVLSNLEDPITLKFYFSKRDARDMPGLLIYGRRIADFLKEYERVSAGKVRLEIYDPRPDSEDEEWAERYGLKAVPRPDGLGKIYLGMVGINSEGTEEAIAFFEPSKEEFLEYDVTRLIYALNQSKRPVVGILSSLDIEGKKGAQPGQGGGIRPWYFVEQLKQFTSVKFLSDKIEKLPDDIDVLLVIHPKKLNEKLLFSLDQFVLAGGRMIALVDPYCGVDPSGSEPGQGTNPKLSFDSPGSKKSSSLNKLFKAWGISVVKEQAVADINLSTAVRDRENGLPTKFVLWLDLGKPQVAKDDIITGMIDRLLFLWAGSINITDTPSVNVKKLIFSSQQGVMLPQKDYEFMGGRPDELLRKVYKRTGSEKVLAVRLDGKFKTNFPDGKPGKPSDSELHMSQAKDYLFESKEESHIIVFSDVDFLHDRFSLQMNNLMGQQFASLRNDNTILLQNAVENMAGSSDLINIRSRGTISRPFTRIEAMEAAARARLSQQEMVFEAEVSNANQRLAGLLGAQQSKGTDGQQVVGEAVLKELKQLRIKKQEAQHRLREIRRTYRRDIERLESWLFFLNTFLIPLFLIVGSGLYLWFRRKRG